ncbi:LysR family transcriptional regulator [Burkholderia pyrrocinia]|uniref:LysR family transcriptional regulator n=1 Tax=Burkholderia pyrrocinia TaxID=60550 RepID=UPI00104F5B9B|nr:LysR family transcriptional regulator [Burkholderia pyrrocinia]TDA48460.1 LysR family transcriptional regulator [Burkholderia pyrrocinia]
MTYDLTDLKVFLAIAEEENVSRGAERCHLAASSASLRMKNLEETLGVTLLTRQARGVTLTPAGRVFREHAGRCLAQLEQMHADLRPFSLGMSGHVTVFANNNAISTHLPGDLARFFAAYPNVRITLEERTSHDIVAAVVAGRAEVGVVALETEHPALAFLPYRKDLLVLLTTIIHPVASKPSLGFRQCLGHPFISLQSGAALHTFLMNHAAALGGRLDVRVQVSGYRAISRLVASGAGIGIVPRTAIEPGDHEQFAIVELEEPWSQRDLRVCVPRNPGDKNIYRDKLVEILCDTRHDSIVAPAP